MTTTRQKLVEMLGGVCARCGFADKRALQIDHINGDGANDRKLLRGGIFAYYLDVPEHAREKLQVLCANCNWIKRAENSENSSPSYRQSVLLAGIRNRWESREMLRAAISHNVGVTYKKADQYIDKMLRIGDLPTDAYPVGESS
jgi:hypothetical protein